MQVYKDHKEKELGGDNALCSNFATRHNANMSQQDKQSTMHSYFKRNESYRNETLSELFKLEQKHIKVYEEQKE